MYDRPSESVLVNVVLPRFPPVIAEGGSAVVLVLLNRVVLLTFINEVPVGPMGPVEPLGPVAPATPVGPPDGPVCPMGPVAPVGPPEGPVTP